jgi:signal peptidase I
MPGDVFTNDRGNMRVRYAGTTKFVSEADFNKAHHFNHHLSRLVGADSYDAMEAAARCAAWKQMNLTPPASLAAKAKGFNADSEYMDYITWQAAALAEARGADPQDDELRQRSARYSLGWYVPDGRVLPLGDNRDNSRDGRYFGPVSVSKVLGKGAFKYWPLDRIGVIR